MQEYLYFVSYQGNETCVANRTILSYPSRIESNADLGTVERMIQEMFDCEEVTILNLQLLRTPNVEVKSSVQL